MNTEQGGTWLLKMPLGSWDVPRSKACLLSALTLASYPFEAGLSWWCACLFVDGETEALRVLQGVSGRAQPGTRSS